MTMEYRVRVKTARFDEPISRPITNDEDGAWEYAEREANLSDARIVWIEKQYVSGWKPIGLEGGKLHQMVQMIAGIELKNGMLPAERCVGYAYGDAADVRIILEVRE